MSIIPLKNKVLVTNIESGDKITSSGIIIPDDDGKERGIRPRWAEVYAIGSEITDLSVGQWVLVSHGRWSRGVPVKTNNETITVRQVDYPDAILLVSDTKP